MGTSRATMSLPRSSYLCVLLLLLAVSATHQSDVDANDGSQPPLTPTYTSMSANGNANGLMIPLSQQGDNPLRTKDDARSSALLDNNDLEQQNPLDYQNPWLQPPSWAAKHGCTPIRWALAIGVGVGVVIGSLLVWFFTSDKETSHAPATTLAPTTAAPTTPKSLAPTTLAPTSLAPTTPAPTTPAPTNPPLCSENPPSPECIGWQDFFDATCSGYCREDVGGSDCKRDDPCACTGNPKRLNGKITCQDGHLIKIDMNSAGLDGTIPEGISALTALTSLDMSEISNIRGGIPNSIGALTALTFMSFQLSEQITGSVPDSIGKLTALITLSMDDTRITGTIPDSITKLTALTALGLNGKVKISGSIPNSIGALTALKILNFQDSDIDGTIPDSIGALTALQDLLLERAHISGSIPESFCALPSMQTCAVVNVSPYGHASNTISCPLPSCTRSLKACGVKSCSTPAPSPA